MKIVVPYQIYTGAGGMHERIFDVPTIFFLGKAIMASFIYSDQNYIVHKAVFFRGIHKAVDDTCRWFVSPTI